MGIQHTLDGDFNQAYEAFDAALELKPEYQYAYLNRGIALMYDGKLSLAIADFQQYQQLKPSDPYRLLWLYFAQAQQNTQQAKSQLAVGATQLTEQDWGRQLVAFFLGEIDEQALLAAASSPAVDAKLRTEQLCEAYFYLAKWHSMQQHPTIAASYYKKVLSTNVYEFVEHRYARLELELLRQSVIADAKAATQTETSHEH